MPRPPRTVLAVLALLWALVAAYALHAQLGLGGHALDAVFQKWVNDAVVLLAAGVCLLRARSDRRERGAWLLIGAGMAVWAVGNIYYSIALIDVDPLPVPSLADALWLGFYPPATVGLLLLVRSRLGHVPRSLWADGALAASTVVAVVAQVTISPLLAQGIHGSVAEVATNFAYPVCDLVLMGLLVAVVALNGWRIGRAWALLAVGFAAFTLTDTAFLYQSANGTYHVGTIVDAGWLVASGAYATAAWLPAGAWRTFAALSPRLLLMPTAFGAVLMSVFIWSAWTGSRLAGVSLAFAIAAFVGLLTRMALTFSEMRRANAALDREREAAEERSRTDSLTGLLNRRAFTELASRELARGARSIGVAGSRMIAIAVLDVDCFKTINDGSGHAVGDRVLVSLAERLERTVRRSDFVARWGGEEFCILLTDVPSDDALRSQLERVRTALSREPLVLSDGHSLAVTCSVGGARTSALATLDTLLAQADEALYAAKRAGRNRVRIATDAIEDAREPLTDQLRAARLVALAASVREGVPELHCVHVAELSELIARRLDVPADVRRRAALAGWLHDVGKAAIPDRILTKPGPLDENDWIVMRTHPAIGEVIVANDPLLAEAAPGVRHHHERFDGDGYPDRLAGERIPLEARIVACADAYTTITNDRPYQAARSQLEALAELRRCSGTHLDPACVDALIGALQHEFAHRLQRQAA